jgi:hypothetical protein
MTRERCQKKILLFDPFKIVRYCTYSSLRFKRSLTHSTKRSDAPYTMMQKPDELFSLLRIMSTVVTGRRFAPDIAIDKIGERDTVVAECTDAHSIICARDHLRLMEAEMKRLSALPVTSKTAELIRNQLDWLDHYLPVAHLIYHTLIYEHSPQVPYGRGDLRVNDRGRITLVIIPQGSPDQSELPVT